MFYNESIVNDDLCELIFEPAGKNFANQSAFGVVTVSSIKGKVFPYSLPSVGPGADPGVQAVSPQVT